MNIQDLSAKLDSVIHNYQNEAGKACQYCNDDCTGDALSASHKATAQALASFKAELLTYLLQHQ